MHGIVVGVHVWRYRYPGGPRRYSGRPLQRRLRCKSLQAAATGRDWLQLTATDCRIGWRRREASRVARAGLSSPGSGPGIDPGNDSSIGTSGGGKNSLMVGCPHGGPGGASKFLLASHQRPGWPIISFYRLRCYACYATRMHSPSHARTPSTQLSFGSSATILANAAVSPLATSQQPRRPQPNSSPAVLVSRYPPHATGPFITQLRLSTHVGR